MADINKDDDSSSQERKIEPGHNAAVIEDGANFNEDVDKHLHRNLKSRQITMIAIGGAIGTGLIIGT